MADTKKLYTTPIISKPKNGEWCIFFRFYNDLTGKWEPKKRTEQLNRIKDLQIKDAEFAALLEARTNWLAMGWNPIADPDFINRPKPPNLEAVSEIEVLKSLTFNKALDHALASCKGDVANKTYSGYRSTVNFIKKSALRKAFDEIRITEIEKQHIKLLMKDCRIENRWSNHAYNKYLSWLSGVVSRLVDDEIIKYNPVHNIKHLPVAETEKFLPYTEAERKTIQEHLYINKYRFFVFLLIIYFTGIRPKELLALKIENINLDLKKIKILPDLIAENSKTKKIRKVPINKELIPFLRELHLEEYDKNCYVFGSPITIVKTGNSIFGRKKNITSHPDYLKPSYQHIKRDTITKLWNQLIINKETGLGIDKYLYAAKHSGANAMILAGADLDALKKLFGHSSKLMTEKYISEIQEVQANTIVNTCIKFSDTQLPVIYSEKSPS